MLVLQVKESTLIEALTKKRTTAGGETVVMNYNMADVRKASETYKDYIETLFLKRNISSTIYNPLYIKTVCREMNLFVGPIISMVFERLSVWCLRVGGILTILIILRKSPLVKRGITPSGF